MSFLKKLKYRLRSTFRELLLYHHNSLEFRAKLFALMIGAEPQSKECSLKFVREIGMEIYNDKERVEVLITTILEYLDKIKRDNGLDMDKLVFDIVKDLKEVKRYADKIDIDQLKKIMSCTHNSDNIIYQERILDFLEREKLSISRVVGLERKSNLS